MFWIGKLAGGSGSTVIRQTTLGPFSTNISPWYAGVTRAGAAIVIDRVVGVRLVDRIRINVHPVRIEAAPSFPMKFRA